MKKIFRIRYFFLVLAILIVGWIGEFVYRTNNSCGPGEHIIQSDVDAVETAKRQTFKARYGSHGIPGYIDEMPGSVEYDQAGCCTVRRSRTIIGVIIWEVSLRGETTGEPKKRYVDALMELSNCGAVFDEVSYIIAEPRTKPPKMYLLPDGWGVGYIFEDASPER